MVFAPWFWVVITTLTQKKYGRLPKHISPPATEGDGLGQLHADGFAPHQALAQPQVGFELTAAQAMDVGLLEPKEGRRIVFS